MFYQAPSSSFLFF
uniref:Uncharacterized protein n=1 Tax=Rhizophora mucronata TaxID=61149 RepID=A0A2P2NE28_RHIMU